MTTRTKLVNRIHVLAQHPAHKAAYELIMTNAAATQNEAELKAMQARLARKAVEFTTGNRYPVSRKGRKHG